MHNVWSAQRQSWWLVVICCSQVPQTSCFASEAETQSCDEDDLTAAPLPAFAGLLSMWVGGEQPRSCTFLSPLPTVKVAQTQTSHPMAGLILMWKFTRLNSQKCQIILRACNAWVWRTFLVRHSIAWRDQALLAFLQSAFRLHSHQHKDKTSWPFLFVFWIQTDCIKESMNKNCGSNNRPLCQGHKWRSRAVRSRGLYHHL